MFKRKVGVDYSGGGRCGGQVGWVGNDGVLIIIRVAEVVSGNGGVIGGEIIVVVPVVVFHVVINGRGVDVVGIVVVIERELRAPFNQ